VLIDAPCTGTGTWRRNPDAKWKLKPGDLVELGEVQRNILDSAWRLVKPGGRLIYATCSLLAEENEAQVAAFLAAHADFRLVPVADLWSETINNATSPPVTPANEPGSIGKASASPPMDPGPIWSNSGAGMTVESGIYCGVTSATLSLTPAQHGTDGFFVAVLERVKVPA
jgi:16S rRNA (cytosine967-C5)-methyltransferase